jgi:histidinol-phosphate phosphatase family protein
MQREINQAVILAGGRGTRLMPLTANCPKPMVHVNEVPFLAVLLDQLVTFGIERVVLLTGYLGEQIAAYFGTSYKSLSIEYSQQSEALDTAERVLAAESLFDSHFLLMYSDNYLRLDFDQHLSQWQTTDSLQLLVQQKIPGNLQIQEDRAVLYDNSRTNPAASYVELGFMLANWQLLKSYFPTEPTNFNQVIQRAILAGTVGATIAKAPYFSISDPLRLQMLERYLQPKKIILLDRDGTINVKAAPGEYISQWSQFEFISTTVRALQLLAEQGFEFIIISNQAGIGRHLYSLEDVTKLHQQMTTELAVNGIVIKDIFICPHHWNELCDCRKPAPGMFYHCEKLHQLDMSKVIYIGDDPRDVLAADNAGAQSIFLAEITVTSKVKPTLGIFHSLLDAIPSIVDFYQQQGC